jgi:hypothetical protein
MAGRWEDLNACAVNILDLYNVMLTVRAILKAA